MKELSNCCNAPIKAHYAYEGTGCYVCEKCGKACDPAIPHTKDTPEAQKPRIEKMYFDDYEKYSFSEDEIVIHHHKFLQDTILTINELITELQRLSDEVRELREKGGGDKYE